MTRFEQIKTELTIEELAKLLCKLSACSFCIASGYCYNHHTGYVDWLKEDLQSTGWLQEHDRQMMLDGARKLTSLPEIIYCKNCRKHNKKVGFDENFHTVWKEDACPLVSWRGKAQGHEFDYQFCAYADKREEVRNERKAEQSQ